MIPKDVLHKIKQIDIKSKYLATEVFSGEYESAFRGHGMEFEEVREYQPGDDIRSIDWNVTARTGNPHVKIFKEERELSVVFLVDSSASLNFGTRKRYKQEVAAEVAAILAYAAIKSSDKVGLITFTDQVEKFIPPKKGTGHVWRVIKEILTFSPEKKGTNLEAALEFLVKVLPRRVVCFVISDFISEDFKKGLGIAAKRHDMIALVLSDPAEDKVPAIGWMNFQDAESGEMRWVDTRSKEFQKTFEKQRQERKKKMTEGFQSLGMDVCSIETNQDYVNPLLKLFRMREKKI